MPAQELDWLDEQYDHADARLRGEMDAQAPQPVPYQPTLVDLVLGGALAALVVAAIAALIDND